MHIVSSQRKAAHTPHCFTDHTQMFHCACPLPEQVTVSREWPVHRFGSMTQIGSARISDHCNLVFLCLSPVIRNIKQHNGNTNIVLSSTLAFKKCRFLQLHGLIIELFSWYQSAPKAHFL